MPINPLLGADVIYFTAGSNAGEIEPRAAKIIHVHSDGTVSLVMWTPFGDPVTHVGITEGKKYGCYIHRPIPKPEAEHEEEN